MIRVFMIRNGAGEEIDIGLALNAYDAFEIAQAHDGQLHDPINFAAADRALMYGARVFMLMNNGFSYYAEAE